MKAPFLLAIGLFSTSAVFAQGGGGPDESCALCVHTTDATCSENCTAQSHDCVTKTFTIPCSGDYSLCAWVTCTEGECSDCQSCVNLFSGSTLYGHCHIIACNNGDCDNCCTVTLLTGLTYTLYVCKTFCNAGGQGCADCDENCTAHGSLSRDVIVCP